jgi:very-short-patch-repair endonuclease
MTHEDVITGQGIAGEKLQQARSFRRNPTRAEHVLWQRLKANRLRGLHFRRQQLIDGFIVDFYCHAIGLVIEVDGPIHSERLAADEERERALSARGLKIVRVTNHDVEQDIDAVLQFILRHCEAEQSPPSLQGRG